MESTKSEVFRFFSLRGPRKTIPTPTNGFVTINPPLLSTGGTYLNSMVVANASSDPPEVQYTTMIALTEAYQDEPTYIATPDQVITAYNNYGVEPFNDWLLANGETATAAEIETAANTQLGVTYTTYLTYENTNNLQQQVWENLVVHVLMSSVTVRDLLQVVLRVSNLLVILRDTPTLLDDQATRRRLINAKVLLPKEIFPLPQPAPPVEEPEPSLADALHEKRATLATNWHKYHNAVEEVKMKYNCQIDKARLNAVESPNFFGADPSDICNLTLPPGDFSNDFSNDFSGPISGTKIDLGTIDKNQFSTPTLSVINEVWCQDINRIRTKDVLERLQVKLDKATSKLAETFQPFDRVTLIGGSLIQTNNDIAFSNIAISSGDGDEKCKVQSLGVADLRIVEQELICYEPGEIAHIENILKGEHKDRITRKLTRRQETFETETIREHETEKDVQTTDRYEMQKESSSVVEKDMQLHAGIQVSANYGVAQINTDIGVVSNQASTQSDRNAVEYSKSVTERARQRIFESVREKRTVTILEEFEETNTHGIDNTAGGTNTVGIYRWINKRYKAQVKNYGKRLMFQMMIPEPALFHIHAMKENPMSGVTVDKPKDPRIGVSLPGQDSDDSTKLLSPNDITESNYLLWAGVYGATVEPMPAYLRIVAKAMHMDRQETKNFPIEDNSLKVPAGYLAKHVYVTGKTPWTGSGAWQEGIVIKIGRQECYIENSYNNVNFTNVALNDETDDIPVSIVSSQIGNDIWNWFILNVEIECQRSAALETQWRIKTYDAIMKAYEEKKAAYDSAVSQMVAQSGIIQIRGNNPIRNRDVEKMELKKACIQFFRGKKWQDTEFSSVKYETYLDKLPEFDNCAAMEDGKEALFFEHAFEWDQVTYTFYPYFWGKKARWTMLYTLDDTDPLFAAFLQAGMARCIVPVRPGFEKAIIHYIEKGEIWNGGEVPSYPDDLYVSIEQELKEPVGLPQGEPWEVILPTSLVILQQVYAGLEEIGLPCED